MTTTTCVRCQHPVGDNAYACTACASTLAGDLRALAELVDDGTTTVARLDRHGDRSKGSGDRAIPVNLTASATLAKAVNAVTTWARIVEDHRGLLAQHGRVRGPACPLGVRCLHPSCAAVRRPAPSPAAAAAEYLAGQVGWLRHQPFAAEAFAELHERTRDLRWLVDAPPVLELVGICDCGAWLYVKQGKATVTCRGKDCERSWDVERSRATLLRELADRLLTAAEIATLAARAGHDRGKVRKLVTTWGRRAVIVTRGERDGASLYRLGDVMTRLPDPRAVLVEEQDRATVATNRD